MFKANKSTPLEVRLWARVDKTAANGCWVWTGARCRGVGHYGSINVNGRPTRVHRLTYELVKGAIPSELEIDHLCRNKLCVNPDHLEAVTSQVNTQRWAATITHCPSGHEYTEDNVWMYRNKRKCKVCHRARANVAAKRRRNVVREDKDPNGK